MKLIINKGDIKNFEDSIKQKFKECGFNVVEEQ